MSAARLMNATNRTSGSRSGWKFNSCRAGARPRAALAEPRSALAWLFLLLFGLVAVPVRVPATEVASPPTPEPAVPSPAPSGFVFSLLPKSFQKRPLMDFNVITEMTDEGRKRPVPAPGKPIRYLTQTGKFLQTGATLSGGEKPPPVPELEAAMYSALAGNGYLPATAPGEKPALLIVFNFGSHGAETAPPGSELLEMAPVTAEELLQFVLRDIRLYKDIVERASLMGGVKFAAELKAALEREIININVNEAAKLHIAPVSPDFDSPYQLFLKGKNTRLVQYLAELAFHTCYFVVASAYDFESVVRNERVLLWRTKMTVDAQGVSMEETLGPLIAQAGPYFGRDMSEVSVVSKRILRDGNVEIGTPTVVEEVRTSAPEKK